MCLIFIQLTHLKARHTFLRVEQQLDGLPGAHDSLLLENVAP